jgi:hypothetical protein
MLECTIYIYLSLRHLGKTAGNQDKIQIYNHRTRTKANNKVLPCFDGMRKVKNN